MDANVGHHPRRPIEEVGAQGVLAPATAPGVGRV